MTEKNPRTVYEDIQEQLDRYYRQHPGRKTKEEVIETIRKSRDRYFFQPIPGWWRTGSYEWTLRVYTRGITHELIRMIRVSDDPDPIRIIIRAVNALEDLWEDSDGKKTATFLYYNLNGMKAVLDIL